MGRRIKKVNHYNQSEVFWKEKILKENTVGGYKRVELCKKGKRKCFFVHRLVGIAFIENKINLPHINHKNLNKSDNRVSNLEWCSPKENVLHANKNGHIANTKGEKHGMSKLTEKQVLEIRERAKTETGYSLSKEYGVATTTIYDIIKRKRWEWLK